jgi:hypothetical protein
VKGTRFFGFVFAFVVFFLVVMLIPLREAAALDNGNQHTGIRITDYSFYAAWGMSTMHNVTIENPTDLAYKTLKVKIDYYLSYYPTEPYTATLVIPVNVEPKSKKTYFTRGLSGLIVNPNGIYGMHLLAGKVEVVEAIPESTI